jgi:Tol biopolymer transport system component
MFDRGMSWLRLHERFGGVLLLMVLAAPAAAGENPQLVSLNFAGVACGHAFFSSPISGTGRYVAFETDAPGMAGSNGKHQIYLRDALLGTTEVVSVDSNEVLASNNCYSPTVSPDARYVWFAAEQPTNLGPAGGWYVRDRALGITTFVDVNGSDLQVSDDGRFALTAAGQILLEDLKTGQVETLSVDELGQPANGQCFLDTRQCLSTDARYVVFDSTATNLVPGLPLNSRQVFVRDRLAGVTSLVSATPAGEPGDNASLGESISADGRFVAFTSLASNLAPLPAGPAPQVFVRDLQTGALELVSVNNDGEPADDGTTGFYVSDTNISADGRFVTHALQSVNLVPGLVGPSIMVCVRDRLAGLTYGASYDYTGQPGGGWDPTISRDGRGIAFVTISQLSVLDHDTDFPHDVYLYDRQPWSEIEPPLAGSAGEPRLVVNGATTAQSGLMLAVTRGLPGAVATLVIGFAEAGVPFKGGVLVPLPAVLAPLPLNGHGLFVLNTHWPAGIPAGIEFVLQAWIPDPAGPHGFSATNGVANTSQ